MEPIEGCDHSRFSLFSYRTLLEEALGLGFSIIGFGEPCPPGGKSLIIRADVDYSPVWALVLAHMNARAGIRGSFFVQPDSPNYNLSSRENTRAVVEINRLGQDVGLHFWEPAFRRGGWTAERAYNSFSQLRERFPFVRPVVCWHNPTRELLDRPDILDGTGLINAYSPEYFAQGRYFSDSNCRNYPLDFLKILEGHEAGPLIFLVHPVNWVMGGGAVEAILKEAFREKLEELHAGFCHNSVWASGLGHGVMEKLRACL